MAEGQHIPAQFTPLQNPETMSKSPIMTWENPSPTAQLFHDVEEINRLIDSQRRYTSMLSDGDIFYSRTDLRMFIDKCKEQARSKILATYTRLTDMPNMDPEMSQNLILHAAAELKLSPMNTQQLISDYPALIHYNWNGSSPLHFAVAATGDQHMERLTPFLTADPHAIHQCDAQSLLPMQIALIHGADMEVVQALIEMHPPVLSRPFIPKTEKSRELKALIGLMPFHIACSLDHSLDVIYRLLVECPECVAVGKAAGKAGGDS